MFRGKSWLAARRAARRRSSWMITARIVRGMTLTLKEREFVKAARFMGQPARKIIARHIVPNMASLLIIDATINVGSAVLAETGLSYFGFGVQPPDVSLGTLIGDGIAVRDHLPVAVPVPGGLPGRLVLAVNCVGDGLRDALDPDLHARTQAREEGQQGEGSPMTSSETPVRLARRPGGRSDRCCEVERPPRVLPQRGGPRAGRARAELPGRARRGARHRRRVRLGQVGVLAGRHGPAAASARITGSIRFQGRELHRPHRHGAVEDPRPAHLDGVPGPAVRAHPRLHRRRPDRRGDPGAPQGRGDQAARGQARRRTARPRRHPERRRARQGVPARVLRRHAAARGDRHGDRQRPGPDHRRRADHRARRDGAGAGAASCSRPRRRSPAPAS